MTTDERVKRLVAAFEHDPRINIHRHPIRVELVEDALILEGEVENIAVKKLALELAGQVPGSLGIVDRLRIARPTAMSDGEIRDHLRNALLQEPALTNVSIQIQTDGETEIIRRVDGDSYILASVQQGVVTLNGEVMSLTHKRLAGVLAWWIPGTRDVINGMEVLPDQVDNDSEIVDAVRLVLEKDPLVEAGRVSVRAEDRVVTLEGAVPNEMIKEAAELDAWFVFGVDNVDNKLEVRA
ncbi:MAG TPA: BON domain-containing protein [Vicinamibacteria bacterium]